MYKKRVAFPLPSPSSDLKVPTLAGKRSSCRHSTTSFSASVVVAGTSYQRSFRILQSEEGSTSFNSDNSANFPGEKKYKEFWGFYFLTIREKIRSRSRPQRILKSLYLSITIQR